MKNIEMYVTPLSHIIKSMVKTDIGDETTGIILSEHWENPRIGNITYLLTNHKCFCKWEWQATTHRA